MLALFELGYLCGDICMFIVYSAWNAIITGRSTCVC